MAMRAGAALLDMEFVQFHPTALAIPGAPRFLVSEAVRGEGALLLNAKGERFVDELLARDQVARAIFREWREDRGPVVLDLRHLDADRVRTRFPRIHATCLRHGVDVTREPVPVTPAAHYLMGGIATDLEGRSSVPGLYAAGETASTGVHGANRLASNSLLEGLVFGARAAQAMVADAGSAGSASGLLAAEGVAEPAVLGRETLRDRAWHALGLERDGPGLRAFLDWVDGLAVPSGRPASRDEAEARNLRDVAGAMAACALFREESRGAHFRTDFPGADDRFAGHTLLAGGAPQLAQPLAAVHSGAR
jgi:L-aspartate oxidase